MTSYPSFSDDDDDEEEEEDDASSASFDEDMDALRPACLLTGAAIIYSTPGPPESVFDSDSDDLEVVRRLRQRFSDSAAGDLANPLSTEPFLPLPLPIASSCSDGEEEDFETLRAIQNRFAAYDHNKEISCAMRGGKLELDAPMNGVSQNASHIMDDGKAENHASACTKCQFTGDKLDHMKNSGFPKAGRLFIDPIKKNRSCQKLLRSKLIEIEARIEEIKKLKERVQILKDFQVSCRIRTGRALSQKKDARVQLITTRRTPKESKAQPKDDDNEDNQAHEFFETPLHEPFDELNTLNTHQKRRSTRRQSRIRQGEETSTNPPELGSETVGEENSQISQIDCALMIQPPDINDFFFDKWIPTI